VQRSEQVLAIRSNQMARRCCTRIELKKMDAAVFLAQNKIESTQARKLQTIDHSFNDKQHPRMRHDPNDGCRTCCTVRAQNFDQYSREDFALPTGYGGVGWPASDKALNAYSLPPAVQARNNQGRIAIDHQPLQRARGGWRRREPAECANSRFVVVDSNDSSTSPTSIRLKHRRRTDGVQRGHQRSLVGDGLGCRDGNA
jgi:hypothetical protein